MIIKQDAINLALDAWMTGTHSEFCLFEVINNTNYVRPSFIGLIILCC